MNVRGRQELVGCVVSGRYRIQSLIGVGGMAEVYLAEHVHIRKQVAIKVLPRGSEKFNEMSSQFEREAIAGAHIDHPNVAAATDFGWLDDGSCFVALEYVQGTTLSKLLALGPLPAARARRIIRQLADGLAACHALGILHRDIKPGNIMIDEANDDLVKLIDFGLARVPVARVSSHSAVELSELGRALPKKKSLREIDEVLDDEPTRRVELAGTVYGTVTYMPPEITLGMGAIDERSDLYALGMVLYEMLAGRTPFDIRKPAQLLVDKRQAPPPIQHRSPEVEVPGALERVAHRLLAPAPAHRFQTAKELLAALDQEASQAGEPAWLRASSTLRIMPAVMVATRDMVGRSRKLGVAALVLGLAVVGSMMLMDRNIDSAQAVPVATQEVTPVVEPIDAASPAVSAQANDTTPAPVDGKVLQRRFLRTHRAGELPQATTHLLAMARTAPSALDDVETRKRAGALAAQLDHGPGSDGTLLFDALKQAEEPGWDLLYEVLSAWGATKAAERAKAILAEPNIRARMSPALKVALELRETRCAAKPTLFERAGDEGDGRARIYLTQLRSSRCQYRLGECCFHAHRGLGKAIAKLGRKR